MPSISSRTVPIPENYISQQKPSASFGLSNIPTTPGLEPKINTTLRSQLPPITAATDNLRQFYMGGQTPQYRVIPVAPLTK